MLTTTASVPLMLSLRLMLRPIPHTCMLAITAMPAIPTVLTVILMVPTTATAQLLLPATNTSPLLLPLMASTNSTNVMLMPNPRLMLPLLTMVVTTATPMPVMVPTDTVDTTAIPMPDTEATDTADTMVDTPMVVMPTANKLKEQLLLLPRTSNNDDDLKSFGFVTTRRRQ